MQNECFILESPKENEESNEEEILRTIFPLKYEKIEKYDDINMDRLYYLNDLESQKNSKLITSNEKEESSNVILLIDDYEAVFNQLQSNQEITNDQEKNNINCYNYDFTVNENYEKEDYNIPYFIKNVISENNCFYPMNNGNDEVIVKFEEPNKKEKKYKTKPKKIPKQNQNQQEKNVEKKKKKVNKPISKVEEKITKKRGPYKKKTKIAEKVKTEDKCFPFNTGKGVLNFGNKSKPIQLNSNFSSIDLSAFLEENKEKYEIDKSEDIYEEKNEEMTIINEQNNTNNDFGLWKFTTKKYFIASNGKKKRVKKKRKFKPDDIRKKIKARFHKIIKNIINENLKKAGSKELFDFIPQSFIGNVSKKVNNKALNLTYKELLSTDFNNELKLKLDSTSIDNTKYLRNQKVLHYLEENPEISERAGFDIIKDMKYIDLLKLYFISAQFENSIKQLKIENESSEYIQEYIYRAKTYIRFFSHL